MSNKREFKFRGKNFTLKLENLKRDYTSLSLYKPLSERTTWYEGHTALIKLYDIIGKPKNMIQYIINSVQKDSYKKKIVAEGDYGYLYWTTESAGDGYISDEPPVARDTFYESLNQNKEYNNFSKDPKFTRTLNDLIWDIVKNE